MHNTINLRSLLAHAQAVTGILSGRYYTDIYAGRPPVGEPSVVREEGGGFELPKADAYSCRLAEEAWAWLDHARTRTLMKEGTVVKKAIHSLAFSFRHRTHDFAVPSKLTGTSKHQPALWRMVRNNVALGTPLHIHEQGGSTSSRPRLVVSYDGRELGEVQSKHVLWLQPLLPFGAGLYLVRVTGQERDFTLGCNVAFGRVGAAVTALNHALGAYVGSNGYGGDGASQASTKAVLTRAQTVPTHAGDGAPSGLRLVSSGTSVAKPQEGSPASDDVLLYRDIDGTARATVGTRPLDHAVRHSPSGIEWGYHGSGPADLSRSILLAFTDEATAERLYQRFKVEVIAAVSHAGGVVQATDIRAWLAVNGR